MPLPLTCGSSAERATPAAASAPRDPRARGGERRAAGQAFGDQRVELRIAVALPPVVARPVDRASTIAPSARGAIFGSAGSALSNVAQPAASSDGHRGGEWETKRAKRIVHGSVPERDEASAPLDVGEHAAQEILQRLELLAA